MKNRWSTYDAPGQAEQNGKLEVKTRVHLFSNPNEREEILEMLKLGTQFNMRYRALFEFYGKDLTAYKRKYPSNKQTNEFLRIFSMYLTDYLEDDCPPSWSDCQTSFWEEFIYTVYPHYLQLSKRKNQSKLFLTQLKKFVQWLDIRSGCTWYPVVEKYAEESSSELGACEEVLNHLFLHEYPDLHHKNWNPSADISKNGEAFRNYDKTLNSVFEVKNIKDRIITLEDIDSNETYQIIDFPTKVLVTGMLLSGIIGKGYNDLYWEWHFTEGVYPQKARKFIRIVY